MSLSTKFSESDCRCFFDRSLGYFKVAQSVIELAKSHGFKTDAKLDELNATELDDLWDAAEAFLNTLAARNVYFGSKENGDWGLWPEMIF